MTAVVEYAEPELVTRPMTVFTARIVETRGMLARIAVLLNPYDGSPRGAQTFSWTAAVALDLLSCT